MSFMLSMFSICLLFSIPMIADNDKNISDVQTLIAEIELLTKQQRIIKKQYEETQKNLEETIAQLNQAQENQEKFSNGLNTLTEKNDNLEKAKNALESELAITEQSLESAITKGYELERFLEKEKIQRKEAEKSNFSIEQKTSQEIIHLQKTIMNYLAQHECDLKKQQKINRAKIQQLLQASENSQQKQTELRDNIISLTEKVQLLTEQNQLLNEKNEQEQNNIVQLRTEKNSLEKDLDSADEELSEYEQNEEELIKEIEKLEEEFNRLEKNHQDLEERAAHEIQQLQLTIQELHQEANNTSWPKALEQHFFKFLLTMACSSLFGYGVGNWKPIS